VDDEGLLLDEVWAVDETSLDEFAEPEELVMDAEESADDDVETVVEAWSVDELAATDEVSGIDEVSAVEDVGSSEEVCVDNASTVVESTADDTVEVVSAGTVSVDMVLGLLMNVSVCVGL
jgi:hypothetical protein